MKDTLQHKDILDTVSNKDLLIASFEAASGSMAAHAFFIRGYACHTGIEPTEALKKFASLADNLTPPEIASVYGSAGRGHRGNEEAINAVYVLAHKMTYTLQEGIGQNVPVDLWDNEQLSSHDIDDVHKVLGKVWKSGSLDEIKNNTKLLAFYFNLYEQTQWYKKMDKFKKQEKKSEGEELYQRLFGI